MADTLPPRRRIDGDVHRIIASRFPPVAVFDTLADPADLEHLYELESLTNPRLRDELGEIHLVPPQERVVGPGTTPIMAAFCHVNRGGSRFSDGTFGVYYAALAEETSLLENVHHRTRMLAAARMPATYVEMRRYVTRVLQPLHGLPRADREALLDPESYDRSSAFGARLRSAGSWGIHYPSVRHRGGQCVAVFRPRALAPARQSSHYRFHWDGERIEHIEVISQVYGLSS